MANNQNRGGSRAAATFKMEHFVIIVNGFQPLAITTKRSISDVVAALDPPLQNTIEFIKSHAVKGILNPVLNYP